MTDRFPTERLHDASRRATNELLERFDPTAGHWFGRLSSSALSTATAVVACRTVLRQAVLHPPAEPYETQRLQALIDGGLRWLVEHQNADGGWGDTDKSLSNISTSMLCHAAFHATETTGLFASTVERAAKYIDTTGGVPAIVRRYGRDKTFSIPILTHCALSGQADWRDVASLPFELACLPARFYKTVRLPVVSYALPALIAIGQVKHHHRPTWFLPWRWVRNLARRPSLRVLERIQPENGGFLEATPLTSFVSMSLAGMGLLDHPVLRRGIAFLVDSVREDGSWPIDTNLATWVTTLSVNALGDELPLEMLPVVARWLLDQQYKTVHAYTNADPGGWSWTDLPGGVPDADDTPGAILALRNIRRRLLSTGEAGWRPLCDEIEIAGARGVGWLLGVQNRNGGFPTFCRGWGKLPFDRSSNDITAHAVRAILAQHSGQFDRVPRCERSVERAFAFLRSQQRADGSWLPLWFGNQHATDDENPTYGTAKVLAAYRDAGKSDAGEAVRGRQWLSAAANPDGGWGAGPGTESSVEETSLAIEALIACGDRGSSVAGGVNWLCRAVETGDFLNPRPIGFYFAKLWYYEDLYPLIFAVSALQSASRSDYNESDRSPASVPLTSQ